MSSRISPSTLQAFNNELVIKLETLREHQHAICQEIEKDEARRAALEHSIADLSAQLDRTNDALANKYAASERYDRLIRDTEDAYEKIVESSQTLLSALQRETTTIVAATTTIPSAKAVGASAAGR
ncbi:Sjogren's syndrome nuclear autoantigen 1, isoform CRA_a [Geranomyces variabilis]|nr:Sjogren's syndrome nuclear autoantigen 1, isoform CRA_a [Geranomyces variabilis]